MTMAKLNVRSPVATPSAAESPALSSEAEAASLSPRTGLLQREQQQPCADPAEALDLINVELGRVREARPDCALFRAHARRPQLLDDAHKKAFLHAESYVVKVTTFLYLLIFSLSGWAIYLTTSLELSADPRF